MSKYFQLNEFLASATAQRLGGAALREQQNPPENIRYNLEALAINVLDKIREKWGTIVISSGYRAPLVNKSVGGVTASQHMSGQASDFSGKTEAENKELLRTILQMINDGEIVVDQILNEYPRADGTPNWIHVSYKADGKNRNQYKVIGNKNNNVFGADPIKAGAVVMIDPNVPKGTDVFAGGTAETNTLTDGGVLKTTRDQDSFKYRIYQEFEPTIVVDELSMKPNDKFGTEPESDITYKDRPANDSEILNTGKTYPYIRINDVYLNIEEIDEMIINHYGFVPTLELTISTSNKALIKTEVIKEGEICSIYCAEDHESINCKGERTGESLIRPLRCDFRITHLFYNEISMQKYSDGLKITIYGELNIPDLHNANISYSFSGTSRDALRETAKQLKLGFCFNNPNNTEDVQVWQCQPTGKQGPDTFIKDVTAHAWLEEHHFFDSWIEPRYNLCFIDVNQQLGWEGLDDGIDIASIKNTLSNIQNSDGTLVTQKYDVKTNNPFFAKLFHNINDEALLAHSSFKVKKYNIVNRSTAVTREIGLIRKAEQSLNNAGLYEENNIEQLEYKLAINWDKVGDPANGKLGNFYVLDGPGQSENYVSAEEINGNYAEKESYKTPEEIIDVQSTCDANTIAASGTNELASGNLSASYAVAFDHNLLNNMQLEKQYVEITCQGNNQGIMRGEKVPCLLIDHSIMENVTAGTNPNTQIFSHIETLASGWFIIDGIKWHYKKNLDPTRNETNWETIVKLCRREWPIPKYVSAETAENNEKREVNVAGGSVKESSSENQSVSEQKDDVTLSEENTKNETQQTTGKVTTDGLTKNMIELWNEIQILFTEAKVTLISGKRWFIDKDKNKIDAWDGRTVDGLYEIMNTDGTIGYYENKNSMHLSGKAIDFLVDTDKGKEYVFKTIANSGEDILEIMFNNNLILQEEKSSNSNVSHYDISFNDIYQKKVAWWTYVSIIRNGATSFVTSKGRTIDFGLFVQKS